MNHDGAVTALTAASIWRKSSFSQAADNCVEVARVSGWVGFRDSKRGPAGPVLAVPESSWRALLRDLRPGR